MSYKYTNDALSHSNITQERLNLSSVKLLLVDHTPIMNDMIIRVFQACGCTDFLQARNGKEALESISQGFFPDVMIAEFQLPEMDGIALTKKLRDIDGSHNPYIPIIMMTAHTELKNIVAMRDAGVNEILAKPFSALTLFSHLFNSFQKPRPFIRSDHYFGPDRRRKALGPLKFGERRNLDPEHQAKFVISETMPAADTESGKGDKWEQLNTENKFEMNQDLIDQFFD
jgi:CheY-like chemotaxis protein